MGTDKMSILILVTGGTFDKEYNEVKGVLYFRETHVPEMLKFGRCELEIQVEKLMMLDSLDMTEDDRIRIRKRCQMADMDKIIITHGTDTMVKTAKVLADSIDDKTVIFTGAMIPYKFGSSDGFFNLGSALAFAQCVDHGIYICMNGTLFPWDNVRKNMDTGIFDNIKEN